MTELPNNNLDLNKNPVSLLAQLAKGVLRSKQKDADGKLDKLIANLTEVQEAFGPDSDPDAAKAEGLSEDEARAVVNLIRSLFDLPETPEEQPVDLDRDLVIEPGKPPTLQLPERTVQFRDLNFDRFKNQSERLLKVAEASKGMKDSLGAKNCWDWVDKIYKKAGVKPGEIVYQTVPRKKIGSFNPAMIFPGAWIYFRNGNKYTGEHSAIVDSYDATTGVAKVISFPGPGNEKPWPRPHEVTLNTRSGALGEILYIRHPKAV